MTTNTWSQKDLFKEEIILFLNLSGQKETFKILTKDIVYSLPESKHEAFKVALDKSIDELISNMADQYKEEFTHAEIKDLLKFYNSKTGKKLASKANVLYEKGQKVGEAWGTNLHQIISEMMKTE
jgi:hypothetical protein